MYQYMIDPFTQQISTTEIYRPADRTFIPFDPLNADYQVYLAWLAEGNTPLPPG